MAKTVTVRGFKGMTNLPGAAAKLLDDEGQMSPQVILNATVTDGGVLQMRRGFQIFNDLDNPHSLWGGSVMLCVADGVIYPTSLWRVMGQSATELCEVTGPRARMNFEELNNQVYAGNPHWKGVYDLATETVRPWGADIPPAPDISPVSGDLPPGTFSLCYTNVTDGRIGGNGPIVQISWEGGSQGIQLHNRPSNALCWITHPNGGKFFLATLTGEVVNGQALQPLPTFSVNPPPGFTHFVFAFGRIWGARGKRVFYSDPFNYDWFRTSNYLPFFEDLVLLAPVTNGIFVNSLKTTWFMEGTEPGKTALRRVGDGAVPGTLAIAQVEGGGYEISRKQTQLPSPIWMSPNGLVVGTHTGHLVHLSEGRVNLPKREQGASLYMVENGIPRVMTSLYGNRLTSTDLLRIFEEGKLFN